MPPQPAPFASQGPEPGTARSGGTAATRPLFEYDGNIGDLYAVFILNLIFSMLTLGIYRFWAITKLRRYLWSHTRLEGSRLSYTGKGGELFLGFLLALVVIAVAAGGLALLAAALIEIDPMLAAIPVVAGYIAMFILFAAARFSAQRYRLSRTEWRGIRGGMQGSALKYGVVWVLYLISTIVTLYQSVPWMQVGLARRRISATRFGSAVFGFDGTAGRLYWAWLGTIVATVALLGAFGVVGYLLFEPVLGPLFSGTLSGKRQEAAVLAALPILIGGALLFGILSGLLATWYVARMLRLMVGHTTATVPAAPHPGGHGAETLRFSCTATAGSLLWLYLSNMLIAIFTLGFGLPILLHRTARYLERTLFVTGHLDADALVQSTLARPKTGEGFLQALDPGVV